VTLDALAKFWKFKRPSPDESLLKAVKKYAWTEVWATMLKKGYEPNESNVIYVNTLEQDFVKVVVMKVVIMKVMVMKVMVMMRKVNLMMKKMKLRSKVWEMMRTKISLMEYGDHYCD